jgi:hypothetical protein
MYGLTSNDRAQIPEGIKQPSTNWTDPVTGVELVGHGIVECGIPLCDDAFIYATLDKTADSICLEIHRLIKGISEHSNHAAFLMAYYSCMRRADFLAGAIYPRLTKFFCAKIDQNLLWAFKSALGTSHLVAPVDAVPDAAFTMDSL